MLKIGISATGVEAGRKGGVSIFVRRLVEAVAAHGKRCSYVVFAGSGTSWWRGLASNDRVQFVEVTASGFVMTVRRALWARFGCLEAESGEESVLRNELDFLAEAHKVDLLHFPGTRISPINIRARCALTFFDMQYAYLPEFFTVEQAAKIDTAYRASVSKSDLVIVPSSFTRDSLLEKYGTGPEKIRLVPVGINTGFKRPDEPEIFRVREKYRLPSRYIFYPANPWPHKNHSRLVEAVRKHNEDRKDDLKLVFTGRLDASRELPAWWSECAASGLVVDAGFIPDTDLASFYAAAEMMVFPSLFEGFGIPLLEAMACGCPMAVSSATSLPEVAGDAALMFDPLNVAEMADCIGRIAGQPATAGELRRKGLQRVEEYRWARIIPQLEEAYESISL